MVMYDCLDCGLRLMAGCYYRLAVVANGDGGVVNDDSNKYYSYDA